MPQPTLGLTDAQADEIHRLTEALACAPNDWSADYSPDLPPGFVAVAIGEAKGRPKFFDIDTEGNILR